MSKIDDLTRLRHIRDSASEAIQFVDGCDRQSLNQNRMLALALVRLIEIMGEAELVESLQSVRSATHKFRGVK